MILKNFFVDNLGWKLLLGWYFFLIGLPLNWDFVYALLNLTRIAEFGAISLGGPLLFPVVEIFRFIFGYIFACLILLLYAHFIQKFESLKKYERPIGFNIISIILLIQFLSLFYILPFGILVSLPALFSFEMGSFIFVWPLFITKILLMIFPLYLFLQLLHLRKRTWKIFLIWLILSVVNLILDGILSYAGVQYLIKLIPNLIILGIITWYLHGKREIFVN